MYKQYGLIDVNTPQSSKTKNNSNSSKPPIDTSSAARSRTYSGGYSSDSSNRVRRKLDNSFMQQVEQRIPIVPQDHWIPPPLPKPKADVSAVSLQSKSPITSADESKHNAINRSYDSRFTAPDSDSQLHYKRHHPRANDSDHNSEPMSSQSHRHHRRHHQHRGGPHSDSRRHHHNHPGAQLTKQRSLDWETQFRDDGGGPRRQHIVPYAYVNHTYQDKVMQKLQAKAIEENVDPKTRAFWLPRSTPSYERIHSQDESVHHMVEEEDDSTSSSSDDDDDDDADNIWVLQKDEKLKKETSV
jgi:hypothetical protein